MPTVLIIILLLYSVRTHIGIPYQFIRGWLGIPASVVIVCVQA